MANVKITDLAAYTNPDSTDVLPIVDVSADVTKKVSIADLLENAGSGTASAPGIAFDGDNNTGIYRPGADQLAISTGGTGRLFIDSSGDAGVGTASPGARLDVLDSIAGGSGGTLAILHNFSDTGGDARYAGLDFKIGTDNATSAIRAYRTNSANNYETNLSFWTNPVGATQTPTERMRITSSGYLRLAGGGIQFNGDTAAANALDDYEEGTCFASTGNWTRASETIYTKIGRYVFINLRGTVSGSSQTLSLPFASPYSDSLMGFSEINGTLTTLILPSTTQITLSVGFHKGYLQYQVA